MKRTALCFLWVFYVAIILYVFFAVVNINMTENFITALTFEIIGFLVPAYLLLVKPVKIGFFVPLMVVTLIYTIALDVVNITCTSIVVPSFFTLIHLIILFIYCLISVPMYVMGKR